MAESHLSELRNELQVKCRESERSQAAADEARRRLRVTETELERQRERQAVLRQELAAAEQAQQCCVQALEARLAECSQQLESYRRLEVELDDVTVQAAESRLGEGDGCTSFIPFLSPVHSESDGEQALFSQVFGAGGSRRSQQRSVVGLAAQCVRVVQLCLWCHCSLKLARRVLQLERLNASLRRELERRATASRETDVKVIQ